MKYGHFAAVQPALAGLALVWKRLICPSQRSTSDLLALLSRLELHRRERDRRLPLRVLNQSISRLGFLVHFEGGILGLTRNRCDKSSLGSSGPSSWVARAVCRRIMIAHHESILQPPASPFCHATGPFLAFYLHRL